MDLIFGSLKNSKNMDLILDKLKKATKTWNLIFCRLKKAKIHGFNFLQVCKSSKSMDLIFCKLKKAQKAWI